MRRFQVSIQRSELCTLADSVGEWEIPILQLVHGAEAVAIGEFKKDSRAYPAAAPEFERLERRYGENPATGVSRVAEVYGPSPGGIRILFQAIKDAATEKNVPETVSGSVALSDELNEEILPPETVENAFEQPLTQATPAKPTVATAKPTAVQKSKGKQLIGKSAPKASAVVPTPKQPSDPITASGDGEPTPIEE